MPTPHPDELWRRATDKWAEISANWPDLAPAVALQQRLVRLTLDACTAVQDTPPLALGLPSIVAKWSRGLPALRNEIVPIPPLLKNFLLPFCQALAEGGAGDSVLHVRDAILTGSIDADSLLSVSLARNHKAIRTSALHMGFSPDLVWLIGELGSAPLAYHLSAGLKASTTNLASTANDTDARGADLQVGQQWMRGYCPSCGSWPVLVEACGGEQTLRCSYCAFAWTLDSRRCVYCANAGEDFVVAAPDVTQPRQRVELCGRCSGYTKVIDVATPTPFPLLAIADLATITLDQGAMERGYRRPEMFDLDSIEPRTSTC